MLQWISVSKLGKEEAIRTYDGLYAIFREIDAKLLGTNVIKDS